MECIRCGGCCQNEFVRTVREEDLDWWRRKQSRDVLAAVEEELELRASLDKKARRGIGAPAACRFLVQEGKGRTSCSIYDVRPQTCQEFIPGKSRLCPLNGKRGKE